MPGAGAQSPRSKAPDTSMRLTPEQRQIIQEEVSSTFEPDAEVRLFGSRTDDTRRGGDIDLHIVTGLPATETLEAEMRLYARLQQRLGERKIDIVTHNRSRPERPIDREAFRTGVLL